MPATRSADPPKLSSRRAPYYTRSTRDTSNSSSSASLSVSSTSFASSSTATSTSSPLSSASSTSSALSSATSASSALTSITSTSSTSSSATSTPHADRGDIIIEGVVLRPTVVFDTFWKYAAERKAIYDRRANGEPAPWTTDKILAHHPFCNTFRVLDEGCQFVITEVIEKGSQDPINVVFRVVLFNVFTKIETYKALENALGPLTWASFDIEKYRAVLFNLKEDGHALCTGSFIKPIPRLGYKESYMNQLALVRYLMGNDLPKMLQNAKYMADIYEFIAAFPGMGEFTTYQLMLNLSYTNVINFHRNDFVIAGIGAVSGLKKLFGASLAEAKKKVRDIEVQIMRWMVNHQAEEFSRLGLTLSGLGPDNLPMDVSDIEHTLCEVDKYARQKHPRITSKGARTHIRRKYTPPEPGTKVKPVVPVIPAAWAHPDRQRPRIRPRRTIVVDQRYAVQCIKAHRKGKNGFEFHVFWVGYPDSDSTWEPYQQLKEDASVIFNEYITGLPDKVRRKIQN